MNIFKQLAAWGTDLKYKYKHDAGFYTHTNIISYLLAFTGIIFCCFFFASYIVHELFILRLQKEFPNIDRATIDFLYANTSYLLFWGLFVVMLVFSVAMAAYIARTTVTPIKDTFALRKRFVSGIAHEIRTPLSVIRINNEIARLGVESHSQFADLFEENIADVDRINEILHRTLLFDRMLLADSLQFQLVNIRELLNIVHNRLVDIAFQNDITIVLSLAETPDISANQTALEHAFFNVLENAIRHSPEGGAVSISSPVIIDGYLKIAISDHGPGIPKADIPHIFEPFYRSEKTGKLSGIGIGLATAEEIIHLHKGTIEVSGNPGTGTIFTFSLPIK